MHRVYEALLADHKELSVVLVVVVVAEVCSE